jgi:ferredoxin-NADP reductase
LIAGGTGIAPLRSIMWDTLEHAPAVGITVVYSARSPEEFAYRDELVTLDREGRITLVLTVTRDAGAEWTGGRRRIDEGLLRSALQTVDTRCLICGPSGLVADAATLLKAAGVSAANILTETYS